jgi:hypothetical protein
MGARIIIGLLTRRATYLVKMVDLSSMSRHGPTEGRPFIGIAVCSPTSVAWDTLGRATFEEIQWARAQSLAS